ncbi:hypothetical protein CALCODRAFT_148418 [Calocera cornea HHB12733]|uniref:Uncharacterized protein n=1 Tax=Calocera cornea HHB12733 TaxID=1353952 RepID=A0A165CQC1_9BASI|nr:hypothetical protein CALCODRAFT_148418 [Calocera cornea HHB12733]
MRPTTSVLLASLLASSVLAAPTPFSRRSIEDDVQSSDVSLFSREPREVDLQSRQLGLLGLIGDSAEAGEDAASAAAKAGSAAAKGGRKGGQASKGPKSEAKHNVTSEVVNIGMEMRSLEARAMKGGKWGRAGTVLGDAGLLGDLNATRIGTVVENHIRREVDEDDFELYDREVDETEANLNKRGILGLLGKGAGRLVGDAGHLSGGGGNSSSSGIGGFLSSIFKRDLEERSKGGKGGKTGSSWGKVGTGLSAAGTVGGFVGDVNTTSIGDWFENHFRRELAEDFDLYSRELFEDEVDLDERGSSELELLEFQDEARAQAAEMGREYALKKAQEAAQAAAKKVNTTSTRRKRDLDDDDLDLEERGKFGKAGTVFKIGGDVAGAMGDVNGTSIENFFSKHFRRELEEGVEY